MSIAVAGPAEDADYVRGGTGDDGLYGDAGDDFIWGGQGDDWLWGGTGHNRLWGGAGDDNLRGEAGNDHMRGGAGDDRLHGEVGNDRLWGGAGADEFVFTGATGRDTIYDFADKEDVIDLSAYDLAGFSEVSASQTGNHVRIALSEHGGGTVVLANFDLADLDAGDFLF